MIIKTAFRAMEASKVTMAEADDSFGTFRRFLVDPMSGRRVELEDVEPPADFVPMWYIELAASEYIRVPDDYQGSPSVPYYNKETRDADLALILDAIAHPERSGVLVLRCDV